MVPYAGYLDQYLVFGGTDQTSFFNDVYTFSTSCVSAMMISVLSTFSALTLLSLSLSLYFILF